MNPANYGYENFTIAQAKRELIKVTREYNKLTRLERTSKRRQPEKQIQIETNATNLYVKRKTLELYIKSKGV